MSGGGWSCPHELGGRCSKVNDLPCDPGMKGCELYGRYAFFDGSKNERLRQKQARSPQRVVAAGAPTADALDNPDDAADRAPAQPSPAAASIATARATSSGPGDSEPRSR